MKNKIFILYVPCPDQRTAKKLSLKLLHEKAAACIPSFPVNAMYPWNTKIEHANEIALIAKTLKKNKSKVKNIIKENHPYEVPCIITYKANVNKAYYNWMKEVLN